MGAKFTREDFQIAAKAAGLDIWTGGNHFDERGGYPIGLDSEGGYEAIWNPAADDGDSRRLQCVLGLSLEFKQGENFSNIVRADGYHGWGYFEAEQAFDVGDDASAARDVVLRCAIAIGRAMP